MFISMLQSVFSHVTSFYAKYVARKGNRFHKKRLQLPRDWFGTPTWPPFSFNVLKHQYSRRDVKWKRSIIIIFKN